MSKTKKIISIMLLLSLMLTFFLPFTVSAEESYTVSGLWLIDTEPELPTTTINQSVTFTTNFDDTVFNTMDIYSSSIYMGNDSLGTMAYSGSTWNDDGYRYVNFGDTAQSVSAEYYSWISKAGKKITITASAVLDDLSKDKNFDVNAYPHNSTDYSLNVIQIAEGEGGELFVYVYQPSDATKDYEAKYINMSLQDISTRDLTYNLYSLTLVNKYGVFDKYVVNDFTVSEDSDRFYNIASIYRLYDEEVDASSEAIDSVQCKAYEVGQSWYTYYYNGELYYEMEKMEVVDIDFHATGSVRYANGLKFGQLYIDSCDSHYVAFSIENYNVEKIYDADIVYTIGTYSWAETYTPYNYSEELVSSTVYKKTLTDLETASNDGSGLFGKTYTWYRIQDVNTFITETQNDANEEFSESELAALNQAEFVFRFAETDYYVTPGSSSSFGSYSVTENVGILRLHFLAEGKYYNLGVVSDLVGTDATPELDVSATDNIINAMDEYLGDFLTFLMLIILVAIILVALVYLEPLASAISKGFKEIISLIWSAVTLPFQLIGSLFNSKRR